MAKEEKQRVIIVSLDATGRQDMEFMLSLPNFKRIVDNGAFCDRVYSVYPSLTYPAHSSIVTGKTPDHHRIVNNTKIQMDRKRPDWLYKEKYIQGKTIVDVAREKNMTTATLLWPVMGGAKVDYNIPEVMVTRKYQSQITVCIANGTPLYLLEMNKKFGHLRNGISQPELDDFLCECAKYTIEKYDPDMMLIHFVDVDSNRHNYGTKGPMIEAALRRHDKRLGELLESLEKTRSLDNTTFIVLGDHCQIDMSTIVYPNKMLCDRGFLTVKDGKITDYKAVCKECDGSAYIYVKDSLKKDEKFLAELRGLLSEMKADERLGIQEIFTNEEATAMGADSRCFCMLEGKRGFYFLNEFDVLTEKVSETKNLKMFATHGCLNTKEENLTFFAAFGKGIKKGARPKEMHLYDEGPTIAKLMGGELPDADGTVIYEMLDI